MKKKEEKESSLFLSNEEFEQDQKYKSQRKKIFLIRILAGVSIFFAFTIFHDVFLNLDFHEKPRDVPSRKSFAEWTEEYGKVYKDLEEFEKRFEIYIENHQQVRKLNEVHEGKTEFALNQFADMDASEFEKKILNKQLSKPFSPPEHKILRSSSSWSSAQLPESFDWRSLGAVTDVKNQGQIGSCWAFSAVENLEGQWALKTKSLVKLSTEQIVDCDGKWPGGSNQSNCGVYGGWPRLAFEYVRHAGGIELEQDYSYCAGDGKCLPCSPPGFDPEECGPAVPYCRLADSCQAKVESDKFVPGLRVANWLQVDNNETEVAIQLKRRGPLSVALNAQLLQFYFGGVFDPFDAICNRKNLNHAVLMVGWGVDTSRIHGKRDFWIVKNSWGTKWGEKGYFRILKGKDKCGITEQVTTAVLA